MADLGGDSTSMMGPLDPSAFAGEPSRTGIYFGDYLNRVVFFLTSINILLLNTNQTFYTSIRIIDEYLVLRILTFGKFQHFNTRT